MGIYNVKIGDEAPEVINAVIEIPKNSQNKYEYDEKGNYFKLDRVLYSPMHYPADYGFIPETRSEDGDHLDVIILGSDPLFTGCVVAIRPIGILKMIDDGDPDFKILAVQEKNPRFKNIKDIKDIESTHEHSLKEIAHFFQVYKDLQGKKVEIQGWEGKMAAIEEIKKAQETFANETKEVELVK